MYVTMSDSLQLPFCLMLISKYFAPVDIPAPCPLLGSVTTVTPSFCNDLPIISSTKSLKVYAATKAQNTFIVALKMVSLFEPLLRLGLVGRNCFGDGMVEYGC